MDYHSLKAEQQKKWHREYANAFWYITIVVLASECIGIAGTSLGLADYVLRYIALPMLLLVVILLFFEWIHPRLVKGQDYFMLVTATAYSTTLILIHTGADFIQAILLLPVMASLFYIQRRLILFAGLLNTAVFLVVTMAVDELAARTTFIEIVTMLAMLAGATGIGFSVIKRGQEVVSHLQSVSESKQELMVQNIIMDKLMKMDALTDLYNHITFHEYLDKLMDLSKNNAFPLYLAIIDIDNFKKVNDTFGHRSGDLVLKSVAGVIKETLTPNDFTARYGGEEFAVLLTEKSFQDAYELVEQIRLKISLIYYEVLNGQTVTVSIGLEQYHIGQDKEHLFHTADELLYLAKRSGKNRTMIVEGALSKDSLPLQT